MNIDWLAWAQLLALGAMLVCAFGAGACLTKYWETR